MNKMDRQSGIGLDKGFQCFQAADRSLSASPRRCKMGFSRFLKSAVPGEIGDEVSGASVIYCEQNA